MADSLSRYRAASPQDKNATRRYSNAQGDSGLGALARYLGLTGYLDRQGRYANEGLALADQGAGELRNANPWGALNMPLGALGYLTSPINALLPGGDEIDATDMSPEARRLLTAGTAGMMAVMPGGPKGPKGLGRGMASLADDATDAERAALKTRLDADAADQAALDALDAADRGPDVKPETVRGWVKPKVTMESVMRDELAQAVAAGDTATAEKLRRELRGMGYAVE